MALEHSSHHNCRWPPHQTAVPLVLKWLLVAFVDRPGPVSLPVPDSLELRYEVTPGISPQQVRNAWRSTVFLTLHLDQVIKPKSTIDVEAPRELPEQVDKRDRYNFLPGWECYESPAFRFGSSISLACISQDSRYTFRYWGRASYISDVKSIAEQLQ